MDNIDKYLVSVQSIENKLKIKSNVISIQKLISDLSRFSDIENLVLLVNRYLEYLQRSSVSPVLINRRSKWLMKYSGQVKDKLSTEFAKRAFRTHNDFYAENLGLMNLVIDLIHEVSRLKLKMVNPFEYDSLILSELNLIINLVGYTVIDSADEEYNLFLKSLCGLIENISKMNDSDRIVVSDEYVRSVVFELRSVRYSLHVRKDSRLIRH